MSFINKNTGLLRVVSSCLQAKRFRGKINIQRPRPPHHLRATYLAVAKPYFHRREEVDIGCTKNIPLWKKENVENPLQKIYARECLDEFKTSQLVVLFHKNPIEMETYNYARVLFHRQKFTLQEYGKETLTMALKGTSYEAFLEHYQFHNVLAFSKDANIKALLKMEKKFPQFILLSAILYGQYINRDDLVKYGEIKNLQAAQAELVQTMNNVGSTFVNQLTTSQQALISQFAEREKQLCEEK